MSNLSELLPTGGGQNAVDFVASGTLGSGATVALKADGTVELVAQTTISSSVSSPISIKNPASGTGGVMNSAVPVFDAANNRYIVFWYDGYRCNLRAGAVAANGTITWGTTLGLSISSKSGFGWDSTQGYGMVVSTNSSYEVRVISIDSSNNITSSSNLWGGRSGGDGSYGPTVTFDVSSGRMLIFEAKDISASYAPICLPIKINGSSSVSVGTATVISSSQTRVETQSAAYDSINEIVVVTRDVYGAAYPALVPITDTGSGGVTVGTDVRLGTTTEDGELVVSMNGSEGVAVHSVYSGSGSVYNIVGYAFDVSGTTITAGSATNLGGYSSRAITYSLGVTYESRSDTYVTTWNQQSNSYAYYSLVTKSSSSVSWGSLGILNSTNPAAFVNGRRMTSAAAPSTSSGYGFILFPYVTDSAGVRDQVYRLVTPSYLQSNNTDFIGITAGAISNAATGTVNVYGGINEAQTGLTIGSDYYVQVDGSLSTATSTVKVGKAISATTINITDLNYD